ncbi:SDR family oxidoreductase [Pontibacter korlensis]|uniref:NAD-dependent dehydratase n=1 Tax=Pontibacter korlensis TaxID=400092 RepID=A0A0E3UYY0_9BACT|nr:SDR family oxidoreductase [Pontibacter korlensis]AKD04856.1 NAD-dependent dehydratase [Pontibacter korlensis]
MKQVLLAGATGHLGRHLLRALKQQGFIVTVLARSEQKASALSPAPDRLLFADATHPDSLSGCCQGIDVVASAVGKSISLKDWSKTTFHEVDYQANYNLLQEAKAAGIQQFIYISAFSAEQHPELAYFKAHADFSEALKQSGISYTIVQPTALFSVFDEMTAMARKGMLGVIDSGAALTNPVFEGDVANVAVESIGGPSEVIPIGGKRIYSRLELAKLVGRAAGYEGRIIHAPKTAIKLLLPLVKLFSPSLCHTLAFLTKVSVENCVAPQLGEFTLEDYLKLPEKASKASA